MLRLPYPPSVNRVWRKCKGRMVLAEPVRAFREQAAWAARAAGIRPLVGAVSVELRLHPKAPKRASDKPVRCIDIDNASKAALDALNGVAYVDDAQVVRLLIERREPIPGGALFVQVTHAAPLPAEKEVR